MPLPRFGHISAKLGWTAPASMVFGSSHVLQSGTRKDQRGGSGLPEIVKRSMAITSPIFLGKMMRKKGVLWQFFTVGRPSWSLSTFVTLRLPRFCEGRSAMAVAQASNMGWDSNHWQNQWWVVYFCYTNLYWHCKKLVSTPESFFRLGVFSDSFDFQGVLWWRRGQKWVAQGWSDLYCFFPPVIWNLKFGHSSLLAHWKFINRYA